MEKKGKKFIINLYKPQCCKKWGFFHLSFTVSPFLKVAVRKQSKKCSLINPVHLSLLEMNSVLLSVRKELEFTLLFL